MPFGKGERHVRRVQMVTGNTCAGAALQERNNMLLGSGGGAGGRYKGNAFIEELPDDDDCFDLGLCCMDVYECMYACMYGSIYARSIYVRTYVCMYVCMYQCTTALA